MTSSVGEKGLVNSLYRFCSQSHGTGYLYIQMTFRHGTGEDYDSTVKKLVEDETDKVE